MPHTPSLCMPQVQLSLMARASPWVGKVGLNQSNIAFVMVKPWLFFTRPSKRTYGPLEDNYRLWLVPHTPSVCEHNWTMSLMACALHTISMHTLSITIADGPCLTVGRKVGSNQSNLFSSWWSHGIFFPQPSTRTYGHLEDNYRLWLMPHTLSVCQL